MVLNPNQEKIIQQLITLERLLSILYAKFAEEFPDHANFWEKISKEEAHAKLIEKLRQAEQKGLLFFKEGKINNISLNVITDRLKKMIEEAKKGKFNLLSALTCAKDYETALIEKNVFTLFDPVNTKVKTTLEILQSDTLGHIEKVKIY